VWGVVKTLSFLEKKKFPRSRKNYYWKSKRFHNKAQFQIQQMAFMIVAVLIFFVLVGLFFLNYQYRSLEGDFDELQKRQAVASLEVLADMPELSCGYLCLDLDKLEIMSIRTDYEEFWPVASLKVYKIPPGFDELKKCPSLNCSYYDVYDSGQENVKEFGTFVSLCTKKVSSGYVYDNCEIGKLVVGVKD